MKTHIHLYIALISILSLNVYAQKSKTTKTAKPTTVEKKQDSYANVDAVKTYERVADKGYKSIDMFKKLGNDSFFNNKLDLAAKWYGELFAMTTDLQPEYYYRYGHSLKAIGQNEKANEMLEKYNQLSGKNNK